MLRYELKKIFGRRKLIVLFVLFTAVTVWTTVTMMYRPMKSEIPEPYFEFLSLGESRLEIIQFIVILTAPAFFPNEMENGMSQILLAARHGKKRLAFTKIMAASVVVNVLCAVSPLCLGIRAEAYRVLFSIGSFAVTAVHLGMIFYIVLSIILFWRVKSVYNT